MSVTCKCHALPTGPQSSVEMPERAFGPCTENLCARVPTLMGAGHCGLHAAALAVGRAWNSFGSNSRWDLRICERVEGAFSRRISGIVGMVSGRCSSER